MLRARLFLFAVTFFCFSALSIAQSLPTGPSTYSLTLSGQPCGKISTSISSAANGYSLTARAKLQINDTQFAFSRNGSIARQFNLVKETLNGSINGSAVLFAVDSVNGKYAIKVSANGQQSSNTLTPPGHTVFLPDFDPAALQVLVTETAINHAVWVLIPKQTGQLYAVQVVNKPQEQGTLDGKPMTVRHITVTIAGVASEIFATTTGLFLQEDTPEQGFALIRDGFKLTPSVTTAPAGEPPQ